MDSVSVLHCGRVSKNNTVIRKEVTRETFRQTSPMIKIDIVDFIYFMEIPHMYDFLR